MTRALVGLLTLTVSVVILRRFGHRIPWLPTRRRREAAWVTSGGALAACALATLSAFWARSAELAHPPLGGRLDELSVVLLMPLVEEILFRELPFLWASREQWHSGFLVIVSSLAFAAYHRLGLLFQSEIHAQAILLQSLLAFPFGVAMMLLRIRYGGLAACVQVHFAFNLFLVAGLYHRPG